MKKNKKWMLYLGIFVISIIIYLGILFVGSSYPFGSKSFLVYDANVQYNNMLHTLIDWIHSDSKASILWDKGLGVPFYQNMLYYCFSPFNIIAIILGENNIELSLLIIIIIKSSLLSVSALYYFEHTNKRENATLVGIPMAFVSVVCSLSYGFCGYALAYCHNIIWLDGMILLPIIAIGIERLVHRGSYKLYLCCLSISFITNFYYAFYVCLFSLIYFLLEDRRSFKDFVKKSLIFAGVSIIAVLLAGFVVIPAVYSIINAAPSVNGLSQNGISTWGSIGEFISSFYPLRKVTCGYLYNHNNFCGTIVIMLVAMFFVSKKETLKQKIKNIMAIAILVLGLNWLNLNYVFHGFSITHGLGNRFAIIFTFLLISMAYSVIIRIDKLNWLDIIIPGAASIAIFSISIIDNRNMVIPWAYLLFLGLTIIFVILFVLYKRNSIKKITLLVWIISLWTIEIVGNSLCSMTIKTNDVDLYKEIRLDAWSEAYDNLITDNGERKTALIYENYAPKTETSWYSSMVDGNAIRAFSSMGMGHFDNVEYVYNGTTPITSLMYNVRYVLTNELGMHGGYHLVESNDIYNIYEADELGGMGFVLENSITEWTGDKEPIENQNEFISLGCGINGNAFSSVMLTDIRESYIGMEKLDSHYGYYKYKCVTDALTPNIIIEFEACEDSELFFYSYDNYEQCVTIYVDEEEVSSSCYYQTEAIISIGEVKKGQIITIAMSSGAGRDMIGEKYYGVYSFNRGLFDSVKEQLLSDKLEFVSYNKNTFTGRINSSKSGILYFAFPYNDGFTVKLDGKEVEKIKLGDGFMGIEINSGEHEVSITYKTKGLGLGLIVSIFGIISLIILMMKNKKQE